MRVALAWVADADPGVAERVRKAAALFGSGEEIPFPLMPANIDPAFQREVAEVHRDLFAEHGELYGANVRWKVERALEVTDEECEESVAAREQYRIDALKALEGFDLLVVPTIGTVAPSRSARRTGAAAERAPLHGAVQRARLARPRAAVRTRRERPPCIRSHWPRPGTATMLSFSARQLALEAALERC